MIPGADQWSADGTAEDPKPTIHAFDDLIDQLNEFAS
jgi:hypothetical protein